MDESSRNTTYPRYLQPAPAQNIIKTPQVGALDSALRYKNTDSYFPSQGSEVATSISSPTFSPKVPSSRAGLPELLEEELKKAAALAVPTATEDEAPKVEPETPGEGGKPAPREMPMPKIEQPPPETKLMPSNAFQTPPLSRSVSATSFALGSNVASSPNKETWDKTIARVINGIVSIKATTTRAFDTESAGDYTATGFVISKKHGLILSNRHVVSPAPITSVAVFVNYEEVPIKPVYRDPTHDFGIFRYDPSKLKHISVEEIELRPELARVGEDIKVVGNDAGEKLSILGSTLARLDRNAPSYGTDCYNDFNTFYMQAASGTSGGSSGSPVLNINGQAVALNAGGSNSSQSSFYLPLDRVVRAVEKIKRGEAVSRGTLQTEFLHYSYDELRRLGLMELMEEECRARDSSATGLLGVIRVLKGGPASPDRPQLPSKAEVAVPIGVTRVHGLEPGDILLTCNGKHITDFTGLWSILDDSVGEDITIEIFRAGKEAKAGTTGRLQVVCTVQDLHTITPNCFLEIGGAVIHDLSYQMGRNHNVQLGTGVFCAASGFILWSSWSRDFLITAVDAKPTKTLFQFIEVIKGIPDYKRVPFMWRSLGKSEDQMMMVDIDRHFFLAAFFERDDKAGTWARRELEGPPLEEVFSALEVKDDAIGTEEDDEEDPEEAGLEKLKGSLVNVVCRLPYTIYGHTSSSDCSGVGVVVSLSPVPLVLFDRSSVPAEMLDIRLTVSNKDIPGQVVYLGAFTLVSFDSKLLPKNISVPEWDTKPLKVRDEIKVIGLTSDQLLVQKETSIASIGVNFNTWQCNPPRHRLINIENINVSESSGCWGGVIVRKPSKTASDEEKRTLKVAAYYMTISSQNKDSDDSFWTQGLDIRRYVIPVVARINEESATGPVEPPRRDLGIEFSDMSLATASTMGLSQRRFDTYVKAAKKIRGAPRPLIVQSHLRPSSVSPEHEDKCLKIADIVLEIDGKPIYRVSQLTELNLESRESVEMVVLRGGKELTLTIPTTPAHPSTGTHVVQFFGAIVHATHAPVLEQVDSKNPSPLIPIKTPGVYVGGVSYGSPALDNIRPTDWILEVDGVSVSSIDDLIDVVKSRKWETGEYIRVKQVSRKGITSVVSIRVDERFWPVLSWKRQSSGSRRWTQERISGLEFVEGII
ncbi:hypothetical protein B9Z19DRAFT_1089096 [Tuber borchii]|uniref:PDZ domain-containing protein n=1 Tax=Tuber borchii TaxID=42251 RepID=A0A2T6ZKP1_TUBBO|nr:hypothetical protein B9Z19DRAFT_1089096 [Tuber borchii]